MAMPSMIDAATQWVQNGFRVFPVKLDKTPLTEHGFKDATMTLLGVRDFWGRWPDAGIGIPTDGLIVLDFDAKSGGLESKEAIEAKYGELPATRTHMTGGGGCHYLYRNPNGTPARNTVQLAGYQGVDLRANGGFIVVPPSKHASGNIYKVIDKSEIVPAPDWLMKLVKEQRPLSGATITPDGISIIEDHTRNATLTSLAGTMRRRGMTQAAIEAALLEENRLRCNPNMTDAEVLVIARSVARYAPEGKKPWNPKDGLAARET